jgi:hypothetical protein
MGKQEMGLGTGPTGDCCNEVLNFVTELRKTVAKWL